MTEPAPPVHPVAARPEPDGLGSDQELVRRILTGEESLFAALVRRYQARVVAHVARMVGSRRNLAGEPFQSLREPSRRLDGRAARRTGRGVPGGIRCHRRLGARGDRLDVDRV